MQDFSANVQTRILALVKSILEQNAITAEDHGKNTSVLLYTVERDTSPRLIHMTYFRIAILASCFALTSVAWQADNDPDRAVKGGNFPAGWNVRPDRGTADQLKFSITGGVYHFGMGSAGTFYRSDWNKTGDFKFSARLTQKAAPSPTRPPTGPGW